MTLERCKAWVQWVKLEKDASEDRLLMARDIEKLVAVVEAAKAIIDYDDYIESFDFSDMESALKALESE